LVDTLHRRHTAADAMLYAPLTFWSLNGKDHAAAAARGFVVIRLTALVIIVGFVAIVVTGR
jgi:hypothetical protein